MKWNTLTTRILAGLVAGLVLGAILAAANPVWRGQVVTLAEGLGGVWLDGLRMTIIPLVFSLLVVGVAQAAGTVRAGGMAGQALLAFGALLLASSIIGAVGEPAMLALWPPPQAASLALRASAHASGGTLPAATPFVSWLGAFVPANPVKAAADGSMASIVMFALVFGLAAARQNEARRSAIYNFFDAVQAAMMTIVGWVLAIAPLGVFLLALAVGAKVGASAVGLLGQYVIMISVLCLTSGAMGLVMALVGGRAGLTRLIGALAPVEAMAISTQSSLACLPVMLEATEALDVPAPTRDLVLPMAVALFRITSPAANLGVVIYVAHVYGVTLDPLKLAAGVIVSALVSIAAVGVASSVTFFVTLVPISAAMGVPMELLPLLLPVETLPDFSRTIGNVTGDVGVAAWAARWRGGAAAPAATT